MAYSVWVALFPLLWESQDKEQQKKQWAGATSLLTKEYLTQQKNLAPNVVQALLHSLLACSSLTEDRLPILSHPHQLLLI